MHAQSLSYRCTGTADLYSVAVSNTKLQAAKAEGEGSVVLKTQSKQVEVFELEHVWLDLGGAIYTYPIQIPVPVEENEPLPGTGNQTFTPHNLTDFNQCRTGICSASRRKQIRCIHGLVTRFMSARNALLAAHVRLARHSGTQSLLVPGNYRR